MYFLANTNRDETNKVIIHFEHEIVIPYEERNELLPTLFYVMPYYLCPTC